MKELYGLKNTVITKWSNKRQLSNKRPLFEKRQLYNIKFVLDAPL